MSSSALFVRLLLCDLRIVLWLFCIILVLFKCTVHWNFWNLNPVWRCSPWQQLSYVMEFKSNEITFNKMLNKVFGYLFFLILTFWLSIRSKPSEIQPNDRTFPQNICSISPELLSISNRLCCLWSSTRDNTLRKSTFPLMSIWRAKADKNTSFENIILHLEI